MNIQLLSPKEAVHVINSLKAEGRRDPRHINLVGGVSIKGSADITCRDVESGEVVWKDSVDNAITDRCRQLWMNNLMYSASLAVSANTEAIDFRRYTFVGPNSANDVPDIGVTRAISGYTASYTYTFPTPSPARTIGCIAIGGNSAGIGMYIYAALLLSPPKTQSTTQTLEVIYKLTASGIA